MDLSLSGGNISGTGDPEPAPCSDARIRGAEVRVPGRQGENFKERGKKEKCIIKEKSHQRIRFRNGCSGHILQEKELEEKYQNERLRAAEAEVRVRGR